MVAWYPSSAPTVAIFGDGFFDSGTTGTTSGYRNRTVSTMYTPMYIPHIERWSTNGHDNDTTPNIIVIYGPYDTCGSLPLVEPVSLIYYPGGARFDDFIARCDAYHPVPPRPRVRAQRSKQRGFRHRHVCRRKV